MAENEVVLEIAVETKKAVDDISSFQRSTVDSFKAISLGIAGVTAAIGAVVIGFKSLGSGISSSIDAANEQSDAINRLNTSLLVAGDYSKQASEGMVEFAQSLSDKIAIDDDAILNNLALAKSFGATNDQAKALVSAAADLAVAMGTDLDSAVSQLGGTLSGSAGKLTKIAPELKNISAEALKSGEAIRILGERFAGSAEAATATYSGSLKKLALGLDAVQTSIGLVITQNPVLIATINALSNVFKKSGEQIDKSRDALIALVSKGILFVIKSANSLASVISVLGDIAQTIIKPFTTTFSILGKGFATLVFAARKVAAILDPTSLNVEGLKAADEALSDLVDRFQTLDAIENFDASALVDSLAQVSFDFAQDVEDQLQNISIDKAIPINVEPVIAPGTKLSIPADLFPQVIGATVPLQATPALPSFGPERGLASSQRELGDLKKAAEDSRIAAEKMEEQNAAIASTVIGAFSKGGYEGAQQVIGAAATGIAAAFGAGPFAQVIGDLVTLLTTDGVVQMIQSVLDNIDDIVLKLAENMPIVAVKLAEILGNPLFAVRLANAVVDGFTKGIDQAINDAWPKLSLLLINAVNVFASLFNDATGGFGTKIAEAAKDLSSKITGAFDNAALGITNFFTNLLTTLEDFVSNLFGGKAKGKISATVSNVKEAAGFGLTSDTGTIQASPATIAAGSSVDFAGVEYLLGRILTAISNPVNVKSSVKVDGRALADIMLELSRRNARTA